MSLSGSAVVAIWNDITDEGRGNFYEWHDRQHIPERIGIPGFKRGRRYIALEGAPEYFTLYEVSNRAVLTGEDYLLRLNNPTEWTSRSVKDFRNTARSLCDVEVSLGAGSGGVLGTISFACDPDKDEEILSNLSETVLPEIAKEPAICAVHACRADEEASNMKTSEQRGRPANAVPRWVIMVEGATKKAVANAFDTRLGAAVFDRWAAENVLRGIYGLQHDLLSAD